MMCESHFPSVDEDAIIDDQVDKGLTDGFNLGYQRDLGGSFIEEVPRVVKMACGGDPCEWVRQVKSNMFCYFLDKNDWALELKSDDETRKRGIGRAISRGLMQGIRPRVFRVRVEREADLLEAECHPIEVLKAMRDLTKE